MTSVTTNSCFVRVSAHGNKPCVEIGNERVALKIACSGCQIVHASAPGVAWNPFWEPPWETVPVSLRRVAARDDRKFSQAQQDVLESQLLASIGGHNLCLDVFGGQSVGETKRAGLSFHGEAGLLEWTVEHVTDDEVTLVCRLHETQLLVKRKFRVEDGSCQVEVTETIENLVGFQRALGRQQHVTIGAEILSEGSPCTFFTNCDKGKTWPVDNGKNSFFSVNEEFEGGSIPRKDGHTDEWAKFPRCDSNSDLCTMRVNPNEKHGFFGLVKPCTKAGEESGSVVFSYVWERAAFPWLMTWEENQCRTNAPWNGRTLARGLEFGSYCFANGRQTNVEQGKLLNTPCFEWLDAYEKKQTQFWISLTVTDRPVQTVEAVKSIISATGMVE